ncbi:HlyD family type I secretion periplasmic adaptor subunit [Thiotrichales bacterium 19S9-12]|nr:HlyD family type I secretion periplasmic adaptor subunit [Thiotrichales bacterium 19S9-11]MCF6812319.1 HlyD family type I secretion periplasmic adaptor subunit [Thiotrichales bacterium 19S9-12]
MLWNKFKSNLKKIITEKRQAPYLPKHILLEERDTRLYLVIASFLLCLFVSLFLIFASVVSIDEKVVTHGEIVPIGGVNIIQHLEGGLVEKLFAINNSYVTKGQPILKLHAVEFLSELNRIESQYQALSLNALRLEAFLSNKNDIALNSVNTTIPKLLIRQENELLHIQNKNRLDQLVILQSEVNISKEEIIKLKQQIDIYKNNLALLDKEVKMYETLISKGYISKKEYLDIKQQYNRESIDLHSLEAQMLEAETKLTEVKHNLESTRSTINEMASEELDKTRSKIKELTYQIIENKDKVSRSVIKAPINGKIVGLEVTVGQVVPHNGIVFKIVPENAKFEAEVKIFPRDVGFVHIHDNVVIRVSAYDYNFYGTIQGKVSSISASTFKDEKGRPYYKGTISLDQQYVDNKKNKLVSGMAIEADIITKQKTIMQYLLKPIHLVITSNFYHRNN